MIVRDIKSVYYDKLAIYLLSEKLYEGYISDIPKELLNKEVIQLGANFNKDIGYTRIEVYI